MQHPGKFLSAIFTFGICLLFLSGSISASETVDPNFNAQIQSTTFLSNAVNALVTRPNGKIIAAGSFNTYNGTPVANLIQINADGSLDTAFNNDLVTNVTFLNSIILLPDGKILLEGGFTFNDGTTFTRAIVRLNADGTRDTTFNYNFPSTIYEVKFDSLGRVLVSGSIQVTVNGNTAYRNLIRLNSDGSLDTSFEAAVATSCLERFTTQGTKIIYTCYNYATQQIAVRRMSEEGIPDTSFTQTLLDSVQIQELKAQADGKIFSFSDHRVTRLNVDGGVDTSFQNTFVFFPGQGRRMMLNADGRVTVMYNNTGNNPSTTRIVRLQTDGTVDPSFTQYTYPDTNINGIALQGDSVLIGDSGATPTVNNFNRLLPSGAVDTSFNAGGSGFTNVVPGKIFAIESLPNDKVLIGGLFDKVNNISRPKVARLNNDGTLDQTFQLNTTPTGNYFSTIANIYHFALQSDGKILMSGSFTYFIGASQRSNIVRLNSDGSIDPTFNLSTTINDWYLFSGFSKNKPVITPTGKSIIGTTRNIVPTTVPQMLTASGSPDSSFAPSLFSTQQVVSAYDLSIQSDGKIVVAGVYVTTTSNETIRRGFVVRLNPNGSPDPQFQTVELPDEDITAIKVFSDNRILAVSRTAGGGRVFRLTATGEVDNLFTSSSADGAINALASLPDGKILIGGAFSNYNGQARRNLALLNANGTLAQNIGSPNREVLCLTVDATGRILIGGAFTIITEPNQTSLSSNRSTDQVLRSYLARLLVQPAVRRTAFDFDGDGKADVSVFRPSAGAWYLNRSTAGFTAVNFGIASDILSPADYDGDGKTDVALFRDGNWYLLRSTAGFLAVSFGQTGDIPIPADYDGDGKSEVAVYRNGSWYILNLVNNQFSAVQFGNATDKPVVGDFDGDGKADQAVFRAAEGYWYLNTSAQGVKAVQFGIATDKLVAADYDGDGKTDIAVYRDGNWYRLNSSNNQFVAVPFGIANDLAVPADYDGDGKADVAVFRNGSWYILQSGSGFTAQAFGVGSDQPLANTFVR
ncbi:MAG: FG-GAP-like repeat-containing protein [Pyrinomonadaceae bacterium]|nr:FG-GAP-like repeat-containing protein [Pyrinomonadaceae bacterium]